MKKKLSKEERMGELMKMVEQFEGTFGRSRSEIPDMAKKNFDVYDGGVITTEGCEWALRLNGPHHYKGARGMLHYAAKIALIGSPFQRAGFPPKFCPVENSAPVDSPIGCGGIFGFCLRGKEDWDKDVLWRGITPTGYDFDWCRQYSSR